MKGEILKQGTVIGITLLFIFFATANIRGESGAVKHRCLVLADSYVSEYAWGGREDYQGPFYHPTHRLFIKGIMNYPERFERWLEGWEVERIDLEKHKGPMVLKGYNLVIIDDVRQYILDPYEPVIVEFVEQGGALLYYAGFWGLGGCPKNEYNTNNNVNSQKSPLSGILPVEIISVPDWETKKESWGNPVFIDKVLGEGIDTSGWKIYGFHITKSRGEVLAEVGNRPFIYQGRSGKGQIIVYTGDDLAWVGTGDKERIFNPFAGTLWQRLALLATGEDVKTIVSKAEVIPDWEKPASFAHSNQPINFLWGGCFNFYGVPIVEKLWGRDMVTHSTNFYMDGNFDTPQVLGDADISGSFACAGLHPYFGSGSGRPCVNNYSYLQSMEEAISKRASEVFQSPWIVYGHLGDESEFGYCNCEYCKKKFKEEFGYDLPELKNDFSPEYLDKWIDYCLFKNRAVGDMYRRAVKTAHQNNPNLKYIFASIPQSGGMAFGDDQFNTQSGFDLLWDHCYPGTQTIRVGLNSAVVEETAELQNRPYAPVLNLLQGFDYPGNVPYMPPAEYIRAMAWQAIAHGTDSVGWFVYNAFWWILPGTEAWQEAGRLGKEVLEPLTPTLYEMLNSPQPIGLLYSYSQEAVDGLKGLAPKDKDDPWNSVVRWWSLHALHEAYEIMKYAHLPFNVVSEHRLFQGKGLPWKVMVIPYVEHLHSKSYQVLEKYIANGGIVYAGANSTLDLPGVRKLPFSFDGFFNVWWPKDRPAEWNQRRSRIYTISTSLAKAAEIQKIFAPLLRESAVTVDDPEVVYNLREAGEARYIFFLNDHQVNPVSPELRKKRQGYNHFSLSPMEFPAVETTVYFKGQGYLYPLLSGIQEPVVLRGDKKVSLGLNLKGGEGRAFLLLPEKIARVEFIEEPVRLPEGIKVKIRVMDRAGPINASLPLQLIFKCQGVEQKVYAATRNGLLEWEVPFLRDFPVTPIDITITDLASGKEVGRKVK